MNINEVISEFEEKRLIATTEGNWDYYLGPVCSDGSQALLYIAKKGSGANSGPWCAVSRLKQHLRHLANVRHGADWKSMIPEDWTVIDWDFFRAHGIY